MYYLLYDNYEIPSKVAYDPERPYLGRLRTDFFPPPHSSATLKRCISRVERRPEIALALLFADISCNTPWIKDHVSFLRTDCPGLSPTAPMAIVQTTWSFPDWRYLIKNRAADIYWKLYGNDVGFWHTTLDLATHSFSTQVNEHSSTIKVFRD